MRIKIFFLTIISIFLLGNTAFCQWSGGGSGLLTPSNTGDGVGVALNEGYKIGNDFVVFSKTNNVFLGNKAGYNNYTSTGPFQNTFVGYEAGFKNISGSLCTFIGYRAGYNNLHASFNTFLGNEAGYNNTSGAYNTFLGNRAGYANTSGNDNTFLGYSTGHNNTTGKENTFLGSYAGISNSTGYNNTFSGSYTGYKNTTGKYNTFSGQKSGYNNNIGNYNTFSGSLSGYKNSSGSYNTFFGYRAGYFNTTGSYNIFSGGFAGYKNSTGKYNTFTGYYAGFSTTTANSNTFTGYYAGRYNTASDNTFSGYKAGEKNATGHDNTFSGSETGSSNTTGDSNTFSGSAAGFSNTTGDDNTFLGHAAGLLNVEGNKNTSVGYYAGLGSFNEDYNNTTALGYSTQVTASNQARIGNTSTTSIGGYTNWSNISDARFKSNIEENVPGLEFIENLRPVTYRMKVDKLNNFLSIPDSLTSDAISQKSIREREAIIHTGFIAQEVEHAAKELNYDFSGVDAPKNDKDHYGLRYAEFVVPLVKAVQELSTLVEEQRERIEAQQEQINALIRSLENGSSEEGVQSEPGERATLFNNNPNPFSDITEIKMYLPETVSNAEIIIYDMTGRKVKAVPVLSRGNNSVILERRELNTGMYIYTLIVDGEIIDSKQMVLKDLGQK